MHKFVRNLLTEWRRLGLPFKDETVIVAVSGGADSASLLLGIHELKYREKLDLRIVAAHFNHKLRGEESDEDENFVRRLTTERGIELAAGRSILSYQGNVEQIARTERYDFLHETAENLNALAVLTAHTIDDQAETFLLNLIRGSGVQGLSGMRPIRELSPAGKLAKPVSLARPMLKWARRADTENFCREMDVQYRFDTMNEDEAFRRVRVRKVLIPLLEDFNPKIVERLAETARLLQNEIANTDEPDHNELSVTDLKILSERSLKSTLRAWLSANRGDLRQIELKHVEAIERLVNSRKSGKTVELPGGSTVVKTGGKLVFNKNKVEKRAPDN